MAFAVPSIPRLVLVTAVWSACALCTGAGAAPATFSGTFEISQLLAFHVVNIRNVPFEIRLRVRDEYRNQMDRPVLVRVFDPQERMIDRIDFEGLQVSGEVPWHEITVDVPARGVGVYQVAVTAFMGLVEFATSPAMSFGVYGAPRLIGRDSMFADTYICLPPGLSQLPVRCEGTVESLTLEDDHGLSKLTLRAPHAQAAVNLPAEGQAIWRMSVAGPPGGGRYTLDFSRHPIILCPDADSARAIHASVDVLDDGTVCFHKFQQRAQQALNRYRALSPEAFRVDPPVLVRFKNHWLAEPARNILLLGPYGAYSGLPTVLKEQNLDPASPWFGSILVWHDEQGRPRLDNPWATCTRLNLSRAAEHMNVLAAVYSIDKPFNPLHRHEALRNRIIIAALQDLMTVREDELPDATLDPNYFGGERGFIMPRITQSFALVARDCPDEVREVWTEGLRRYVDRQTISQVASVVNQWTFYFVAFQEFLDSTGDPWYGTVLQRHLRWLLTTNQWGLGLAEAGYLTEAEGFDATYSGMSLHNLAWVWEQSRDPNLGRLLEQCITVLNHTIAPEPNGSRLGASNFSHRTPGDWTDPQWGAGLSMLADDLPAAAAHAGHTWPVARMTALDADRRLAEQELLERLSYLPEDALSNPTTGAPLIMGGPTLHFRAWQHFSKQPLAGRLPMEESEHFTRIFGQELMSVRRPAYYAFTYAGAPMGEWKKSTRPDDAHRQFPQNGGGLCLFWSPRFGSSILAKNWSPYAAHTIIAERTGEGADWEDYWTVRGEFDADRAVAVTTGRVRAKPLSFRREATFHDDRVTMDLLLRSEGAVTFKAMWECFPYSMAKPGRIVVTPVDFQGRAVKSQPAQAVVFRSVGPEVHLLVFDSPRLCDVGVERSTDLYGNKREHGRVLTALPAQWTAEIQHRARWSLMAVPADRVPQAIAEAVRTLK
jgi:hypothetical protein